MKTIGLIGGMSWESSAVYYNLINKQVSEELAGVHSAKIIMYSLNFDDLVDLQHNEKWLEIANKILDISEILSNAGAECILICCNTIHVVAKQVRDKISIPLIHIAEETGKEIVKSNIHKVALIGTRFTMEKDFFKEILEGKCNIETILPDKTDRDFIHNSIYDEFCKGVFRLETKINILKIIDKLIADGAKGIILGCTELSILINQSDLKIPIFDTTSIHSKSAVKFALN